MDITPYIQRVEPAPKAVFDKLSTHREKPRFFINAGGSWEPVTWGEYARQIETIAAGLLDAGVLSRGDRGAIFAPNRVEWMSAALAIEAAAGVMVPVYPASTVDQAGYVIEHSEATVLFVDTAAVLKKVFARPEAYRSLKMVVLMDASLDAAGLGAQSEATRATVEALVGLCVSWESLSARGAARLLREPTLVHDSIAGIDLDQPAIMLYTSGTTGNPKGVPLSHNNVGVNGRDWLVCNGPVLGDDGVDILWLPMSHIFGFGEGCLGNVLGFTSYLCDPASVFGLLPKVRPTVFMSVPAYWEKIAMAVATVDGDEARRAKMDEVTGGRLQFCLSGGAGLKREVKELFHACGILIIEGYGLTECSPTLTLNRPDRFRFDTVGVTLPSVELKLAEDGEILARGPNVFKGYFKDPDATKGAFTEDGWFLTGDVGRWTEDGFLQIVDRKKDILVTAGGKNVPPVNIEVRFADDPLFAHVVVYGDAKRYLVAAVWVNESAANSRIDAAVTDPVERQKLLASQVQASVDKVNASLASYESLKRFVIIPSPLTVESGLLTASLKVRRKKVYETFRSQFEALYEA